MSGCVSAFDQHRGELRAALDAGRPDAAAGMLDDPEVQSLYDERNRTLWLMERGAVALSMGEPTLALERLIDAEKAIEAKRELDSADQLATWMLNDTVAPYLAPPHEEMYLHVLRLLAQLERGNLDGGATVEARRLAGLSNILRDRYLREVAALKSEAGERSQLMERQVGPGLATPTGGEFIESALGTYLTAVTFMKTGDREFQRVAGRRLVEAMEAQPNLFAGIPIDRFRGVGELEAGSANVLVVALRGRGPTLVAERVGPIAIYSAPVYFELPRLRTRGGAAGPVTARIESVGAAAEARSVTLDDIEDLGRVSEANFERTLPLIYQRTLLRYLLKAGATIGASEAVAQGQGSGENRDLIRVVGGLIGLAFLGATERADLRSWEALPATASVALLKLEPGTYRIRVGEGAANAAEGVLGGWREIEIPASDPAGTLTTVVQVLP